MFVQGLVGADLGLEGDLGVNMLLLGLLFKMQVLQVERLGTVLLAVLRTIGQLYLRGCLARGTLSFWGHTEPSRYAIVYFSIVIRSCAVL